MIGLTFRCEKLTHCLIPSFKETTGPWMVFHICEARGN